MRLTSVVTLSAAMLVSSAAMAQNQKLATNEPSTNTGYQAPAKEPAAAQAPAEKKICKRLATSGTRIAPRVCLTEKDWKKVEEITD